MGILDDFDLFGALRRNGLLQDINAGIAPEQQIGAGAPMSLAPPAMSQGVMNAQASMPQPQRASAPMMAPQPQQQPQAMPQPVADQGDSRLMLGLKGFLGNMGAGPLGALAGGLGAAVTGLPTDAGTIEANRQRATQTATAKALLAKGASPDEVAAAANSPDLMKALVNKYYGQQAPMNLGNGYIWDAKQGKAIRAYEPDAKPPTPLGEGYVWNPETGKVERAYTPNGKQTISSDIEQRKAAAAQMGLKPDDPAYKSFVLTGKMPREDQAPLTATDKQAIMEADDAVLQSRTAIDNLKKIKTLSKQAYEGPTANARGYVSSLFGSGAGEATTEMDNLITTNALQQLKAIFGGNPTEGERAILLKIQGASSLPDSVRQKVFDEAIRLAERRMEFNKQRADSLRGGTYYKQNGAPTIGNSGSIAGGTYTYDPATKAVQ